ncbi:hypothetical protein EUGRSUZ_D00232 [Eucalyptus grandis]|uniref:Uncharacterized protein n=2 Tax=Eucalyptus grandis TaxID=71139 RepID=A0A059CCD4_EUCGR|nr:hypothetical protein EUGRSUZ_D00232 [Eucalyptus grandis]
MVMIHPPHSCCPTHNALAMYIAHEPFQHEAAPVCRRSSLLPCPSVSVCGVICPFLFLNLFGTIAWCYVCEQWDF